LCTGGNVAIDRQMSEKGTDLGFAHFARVPFVMKQNETLDPTDIGFFRAPTVVPDTNRLHHRA